MRDFFIKSLNITIPVIIVIYFIGIILTAIQFAQMGGALMALLVFVGGVFAVFVLGGFLYLGLGIYENTRRMADGMGR